MTELGQSLSNHPYLEIFKGDSPEDLLMQLKQIRLPFKIVGYSVSGSRHFALVDLSRPVRKISKTKIENT